MSNEKNMEFNQDQPLAKDLVDRQDNRTTSPHQIDRHHEPYFRLESKSKFLVALLALIIPGTGHLYLGLMKRGFFIMLSMALNIAAIPFVVFSFNGSTEAIPIVVALGLLIPIQYFFNVFDALQKTDYVNYKIQGLNLSTEYEVDDIPIKIKSGSLGILLIGIGLLFLAEQIFPGMLKAIFKNAGFILFSFLLIGTGGFLFYREWKKRSA